MSLCAVGGGVFWSLALTAVSSQSCPPSLCGLGPRRPSARSQALGPGPGLFRSLACFCLFRSICGPCDLASFSGVERNPGSDKEGVRATEAEGQSRVNAENVRRAKGRSREEWSCASAGPARVGGRRTGVLGGDGPPETLKGGTWGKVRLSSCFRMRVSDQMLRVPCQHGDPGSRGGSLSSEEGSWWPLDR